MEGVLEGATALCTCKLAFSLLLLPFLPPSRSPVSFCCCCLLVFTDLALAAFLAFLCVSKSELTPRRDAVALRCLLFLSRVYGAALLLTCPLLTLETLGRLRRAGAAPSHADGPRSGAREAAGQAEEGGGPPDAAKQQSHGVSFLCCLSVWVLTALDVRWRWMLEEVRASACLRTTSSLLTCLPGLFSPVSSSSSSGRSCCIALTFLLLVLLLLLALLLFLTEGLRARFQTSAEPAGAQGLFSSWIPARPAPPQTLVSADACRVDPEKTAGSCVFPKESAHVSAPQRGHAAIIPPEPVPAGQKQKRTKGDKALTFTVREAQEERGRCVWCDWAFPCLGLNVITALTGVLCIFVLPLILSVNIVLVRTVDYLMELSVRALLAPSAADKRSTSTSGQATGGRSTCQRAFQESGFSRAGSHLEIC